MKNLDLYKVIIFSSILLIPAAGFWAYWQTQRLETATKAIEVATKRNGLLEKIGLLQKELETIKDSERANREVGPSIYFERRIIESARDGNLLINDISIGNETERAKSKQHAVDFEVQIEFKRQGKPLPLPREFIHVMLYNCESQSKGVWKMRNISLSNVEAGSANAKKPPPKTVSDTWQVNKLVFARREPAKSKSGKS